MKDDKWKMENEHSKLSIFHFPISNCHFSFVP